MKKSCLFLLSLVLVISQSFGQNDPAAKKVLDAVSAKVKGLKSIVTTFSIRQVTSKGKDNGTKTGQISVKGQKYLLKQGKMEVICDGSKTYNYDGNKTVTVAAADEPGQTLAPQKLLSGAYGKDFSTKVLPAQVNLIVI